MSAVTLKKASRGWVVELRKDAATVFKYRYRTERQARYMAAVFKLEPSTLPKPDAIRIVKSKKTTAQALLLAATEAPWTDAFEEWSESHTGSL